MQLNKHTFAGLQLKQICFCVFLFVLSCRLQAAQPLTATEASPIFELVTLGDAGGIQDGNLSAFLFRALSEPNYIALDAGTVINGINVSLANNAFKDVALNADKKLSLTGNILQHHIKGYLISHGHLDHVAGLLIAAPDDSNKPIYALKSVNQTIMDSYFNWKAWPNFTNKGIPPFLNTYQVIDLVPQQSISLQNTQLKVTAFSLSHSVESTAFVIEFQDNLFVYFGDTGPDEVEKQEKLATIWHYLAKQMQTKKLRGLVIEVSFDNQQPDNLLFGHLTPKWLMSELTYFYSLVEQKEQFQSMGVIISHIKYSLKSGLDPRDKIQQELQQGNTLGFNFILAKQGRRIIL
ncbi:MBL fold metallo-hydrolase [Paraglaciecola sp. MB-3u-78]|uniref:MBL fold metallo-hydrolase n=1 Tax=Paraglaciecola sp. MB-3u-78 TaxID=2058332 RepID=UPI000C3489D9|nr:3',5'-cyclic-nucleotide phosphodiesterase [Paraglaciecola sp. MB-3u-78]PKG98608.1 3',5'-cyclic-nucleotide phosphodiesterase [Paraglaciecola sp. MB-3u-78]